MAWRWQSTQMRLYSAVCFIRFTTLEGSFTDCSTVPGGGGVEGADFVLYVTSEDSSFCHPNEASGLVFAHATHCRQDQHDRPVAGTLNFCPGQLTPSDDLFDYQVDLTLHQLIHALGFSASLMPYFREESGEPRNERDEATGTPLSLTGVL
eukprot:gene3601-4529_t